MLRDLILLEGSVYQNYLFGFSIAYTFVWINNTFV